MFKIPITSDNRNSIINSNCYFCNISLIDIPDQQTKIAIVEDSGAYLLGYVCNECEIKK